ncbi:ArsR family transcriptional regulator [Bogoriella caseilytica]|uniref:ArsR family transcriptional regulator n=1 Tax=Bogoriella caseilytica TaxID=56055 RepID=UPI000F480353
MRRSRQRAIHSSGTPPRIICDLTGPVWLSQPTVSHHMKLLVDAGLASREQRGERAYFRVVPEAPEQASRALHP